MSWLPSNANSLQLALSADQEHLRAYVAPLAGGRYVAWAPAFFRVLRRPARQLRSHLDLTDDVVSTLYDPQGQANATAIYSLANVPERGLMQLYGGRAVAASQDAAVAQAERASARLLTALRGRYRQSVINPLTTEEATAYYRHLLACACTAAFLGQPVRRMTGAAVGSDGVGQLVTADAQEQLETIVAGLEDAPFVLQTILEPYSALDIRTLLERTAQELSRFASLVKGSEGLTISLSPGTLVTPVSGVLRQETHSTGISHVEQRAALEEQAHRLEAEQAHGQTGWERQQQSQEQFQGHTDTAYAAGAHVDEHVSEHETARVALERDYAEQYQAHREYSGAEHGVVHDTTQRAATQTGTRHTDTGEQGTLHAHDSSDESTSGYRSGSGSRAESEAYSFGESATYGGSYHESTQRTFAGGGAEQSGAHYQSAEYSAGTQGSEQQYARRGESDVQGAGAQMQTVAEKTVEGEARGGAMVPIFGGAQVRGSESTGERGALTESRQQERLTAAGETTAQEHTTGAEVGGGARTQDSEYQRSGQEQSGGDQSWSGSEYRSGGGTRSSNTAYSYGESYTDQHHTERDSARTWESRVAQDAAWRQTTQDRAAGVQTYDRAVSGVMDESGSRAGHLSQVDATVADRDLTRATDRREAGWRSEDQSGQVARQQTESGDLTMRQAQLAESESYSRRAAGSVSGETGSFAGTGTTTVRGFTGPTGGGIYAGLAVTRQTLDAQREIIARTLEQQKERLRIGLDTGFFRCQTVLMTPDEWLLERLAGAALAAWREEDVVIPAFVRAGDELLWQHALHFSLDPRPSGSVFGDLLHGQGLTTNEIAPLVHPVRVEGRGGVSTTQRPWPAILGMTNQPGEVELGRQISPTTGQTTDCIYRLARNDLLHLVAVGASGSGKSNSALWTISQMLNRWREDPATGQPQPVPTTGGWHTVVPDGRPAVGVTVLDPTGEWRRLAQFVLNDEFHFYSLTNPHFHGLGFNPVAIPSPYITPAAWISILSKRWALAYATGGGGVALLRRVLRELYTAHAVFTHPEYSQRLTLSEVYAQGQQVLAELLKLRQVDSISPGILKRILDKMEEFLPGGIHYAAFGQPGYAPVEQWLWPYGVTVIEGDFGDDEQLKLFIIGLLGMAMYQHAAGLYGATLQAGQSYLRPQLIVFEEAHVVMSGREPTETEAAVEKTAGLWDSLADRGRKLGLVYWALAQHWLGLPEAIVSAAKIVVAQALNTLDDAKAASAAVGIRPGSSAMDEVTQLQDLLLALPVGVGVVQRKRLTKEELEEGAGAAPVAVQFPNLALVQPPNNAQLDYLLTNAAALTQRQRQSWAQSQQLAGGLP